LVSHGHPPKIFLLLRQAKNFFEMLEPLFSRKHGQARLTVAARLGRQQALCQGFGGVYIDRRSVWMKAAKRPNIASKNV
jgi:hypothetical protein